MEKTRLSKREVEIRKTLAKALFKDGVTQRELAGRVGISEVTISKWVKEENWAKERAGLMMTKGEQLKRLYEQFSALNETIAQRKEGARFPTPAEADTLVKITKSISQMETDVALAATIQAFRNLIRFVMPESLGDAKIITRWSDLFIQTLLK